MLNKENTQKYLSGKGKYIVTIFRYIWIVPSVLSTDPVYDTLINGQDFIWHPFHTICLVSAITLLLIYIVLQRLSSGNRKVE